MHHLGQPVNNDKNEVVIVVLPVRGQWQSGHKVHGEVFPPMSRYKQGLQVTIKLISDRFQSQTNDTSIAIAPDVSSQAQLIVFLTNQLSCFVNNKMPCKRIIVVTTYHLGMNNFWDVWEFLILEHSLDVFLVLWKTSSS